MDNYAMMCDCPEIQGQQKTEDDSQYYVKEDIWGFDDEDAQDRKENYESINRMRARDHPERLPVVRQPLLKCGETTIWAYPLDEDCDCGIRCVGRLVNDYPDKFIWLPRQEDWQNILFTEHYAPAIPTAKRVRAAIMIMFREHVDYMEGWKIDQPCEAWARLYMNFHNKTREKGEWV